MDLDILLNIQQAKTEPNTPVTYRNIDIPNRKNGIENPKYDSTPKNIANITSGKSSKNLAGLASLSQN